MKEERIKYLIDRYYQGLSTEGEEIEIKKFFENGTIQGYEAESVLFREYDRLSETPEPSKDFEQKIIMAIDNPIKKSIGKQKSYSSNAWNKALLTNIAALFLSLVGAYIFFNNYNKPIDTFRDPEVAYNEAVVILNKVSIQLNAGLSALEPITKIEDAQIMGVSKVENSLSVIMNNYPFTK